MKKRVIIRDDTLKVRAKAMIDMIPLDVIHEVMIKPHRTSRTAQQNALYWKWNSFIGDELGYTKEEMHDLNRERFGVPLLVEIDPDGFGLVVESVHNIQDPQQRYAAIAQLGKLVHTPQFDVPTMMAYLNEIDQWSISMGIPLPVPQHLNLMVKDHRGQRSVEVGTESRCVCQSYNERTEKHVEDCPCE